MLTRTPLGIAVRQAHAVIELDKCVGVARHHDAEATAEFAAQALRHVERQGLLRQSGAPRFGAGIFPP